MTATREDDGVAGRRADVGGRQETGQVAAALLPQHLPEAQQGEGHERGDDGDDDGQGCAAGQGGAAGLGRAGRGGRSSGAGWGRRDACGHPQPPKTCWYSARISSLSAPIAAQSGETTGAPSGTVGPSTPGRVG